ncbi:MAG: hypothetical protein AMJ46_09505 [Latescibacteria bacterium DG_63]|nr:MAG: hypothetical protein AMJ46_09505 [Latescibacteria bacterium DG_63]
MKNVLAILTLVILAAFVINGVASGAVTGIHREYFLSSDVEPHVYVSRDMFFLSSWGGTTPSSSYIEVCTEAGAKYQGRLVRISDHEIALSLGYGVKKTGQRVEKQVVIPKKEVVIAWIYW